MKKIWVSVSYPMRVEIDFDETKKSDKSYLDEKRLEALNKADDIKETCEPDPCIVDSEVYELVE